MTADEVREKIDQLITDKGYTYRELSLAIGKGETYLFQYLKRKSPRRLDEPARKKLAYILGVNEQELSDMPLLPTSTTPTISPNSVSIKIIDAVACCGNGVENIDDVVSGTWDMAWADYKQLAVNSNPETVRMLQVKGDSMAPKLNTGDWVLVDTAQNFISSDGLYAIRMATGLAIKRIQSGLSEITIRSDNPAYGEITAKVGEIAIVGRVIYALHAEKLV